MLEWIWLSACVLLTQIIFGSNAMKQCRDSHNNMDQTCSDFEYCCRELTLGKDKGACCSIQFPWWAWALIGAVALLLVIIIFSCCCCCKNKQQPPLEGPAYQATYFYPPMQQQYPPINPNVQPYNLPPMQQMYPSPCVPPYYASPYGGIPPMNPNFSAYGQQNAALNTF